MQDVISNQHLPHHADRIGLTIFVALAFHAIIILGVSFDFEDPTDAEMPQSLEVTLVTSHSLESPLDASYEAQADQQGGGNLDDKIKPSSPFSNPTPTSHDGIAPRSEIGLTPPPLEKSPKQIEILTAEEAERKEKSDKYKKEVPDPIDTEIAAQMVEQSREIARIQAEIDQTRRAIDKAKNENNIQGINARKAVDAAYKTAWREKVQRIADINFPQEAVSKNLTGRLTLAVEINKDGSLRDIRLAKSSGHKLLDDYAIRIVRMASPYSPLPPELTKEKDFLPITQNWTFDIKYGLSTQTR